MKFICFYDRCFNGFCLISMNNVRCICWCGLKIYISMGVFDISEFYKFIYERRNIFEIKFF